MHLNPLHFLFESRKNPNARTLRTNFREKLIDAFRAISGFVDFNTAFENSADSFLTLEAIRYNINIEHKHHRTLGIIDYLTCGVLWGMEEAFTFLVDIMHTAKVKLTVSRLGPWYWRWIPALLLLPVATIALVSRSILFMNISVRYLVSAILTIIATPIIGLVAMISEKQAMTIKKEAFTVESYANTYQTLAEYADFMKHQDITPHFDTELRLNDDIAVVVIDANTTLDTTSVEQLITDQQITTPTLALVRAMYPDVDSHAHYHGDPLKIRVYKRLDSLPMATLRAFFDQYVGYFLLIDEKTNVAKLYFYQHGIQDEASFIYTMKPDEPYNELLTTLKPFADRDYNETLLTQDQINQWIVANPKRTKRSVYVPYVETYQCFIAGNETDELIEIQDPEKTEGIEKDYSLFIKRLQSTAYVPKTTIIHETIVPFRLGENNSAYHQLNRHFDLHQHKQLHLGIQAGIPFTPGKEMNEAQQRKYSFFGMIKTREQLSNLEAINFANIDTINAEMYLPLPF